MSNYIIDVTTIVTLITDITQDKEMTEYYLVNINTKDKVIRELHEDDKISNVSVKINNILKNNNVFIVDSAMNKVIEMVEAIGSDQEKYRLAKLKEKIIIIPDERCSSFDTIPNTKLWNKWTRSTYETATAKNYTLISGNIKATNSAYENKLTDIDIIYHNSRCLFGNKREKAVNDHRELHKLK